MNLEETVRLPKMPWDTEKWCASAKRQRMKDYQQAWYLNLLCHEWKSEKPGYLPLDGQLWRLAGAHNKAFFDQNSAVVMACFKVAEIDGRKWIYNEVLIKELESASKKYKQAVTRGKKSFSSRALDGVGFALPSWVPKEAWDEYEVMRHKIRKPMTDGARKLAVSELQSLKELGHDPELVLNQSVLNSWQGLFPLREGSSKQKVILMGKRCINCDRSFKPEDSTAERNQELCCSKQCEDAIAQMRERLPR